MAHKTVEEELKEVRSTNKWLLFLLGWVGMGMLMTTTFLVTTTTSDANDPIECVWVDDQRGQP